MEHPSTGYDFEVIGDMGKDFECSICMLLLREPVELPCAHVFCKVCLERWQNNPMEKDAAFLCPSCKKVYQREQVTGNKYVEKLVKTSLQVKCKENKSGCKWEGKIIDHTQHEEMCIYKSINCTFVGCKETMIVMDQIKHQSECMYRQVQCKHCLSEVQFIILKSHYEKCAEFPINCPNNGCSIITPRKEIYNHTQNECQYQIMNCEYQSVGCKHQLQRRNINQHQIESLAVHMSMLLNGFSITSLELSSVKEKLWQTEENLRSTVKRLQKTEEKLQHSEEKLTVTAQILNNTNNILNDTQEELRKTNQNLVIANESTTKIRNHDQEIDKLCFTLARRSWGKLFEVKLGLESLATMDYNQIQEINRTIHCPDMWSDLHKIIEGEIIDVPKGYSDRFFQVIDMMERNKLYNISEKEVFVKVDVANYTHLYTSFSNSFVTLRNHPQTIFSSENFLLHTIETYIQLIVILPGWHNNNAKIFLLDPTKNTSKLLHSRSSHTIEKNMVSSNNMILVKVVLQ